MGLTIVLGTLKLAWIQLYTQFLFCVTKTIQTNHDEQSPPSRIEEVHGQTFVSKTQRRKEYCILRGFDPFMNLVIDETVEETKEGNRNNIGMVVVRGNSIIMLEALERIMS